MRLRLVLLLAIFWSKTVNSWWTHPFAARVKGEEIEVAELADFLGINYIGQVLPDTDFYYFKIFPLRPGRKWIYPTAMLLDVRVQQVLLQTPHLRLVRNRDFFNDKVTNISLLKTLNTSTAKLNFNDPFFPFQWHFNRKWANVFPAWHRGFNGKGITVCILDDGLDYLNPDISANYEPESSFDVSSLDHKDLDPMPDLSQPQYNSHGTHCAAIISAAANNNYCGVGVAYEAKVGAVRLLDGSQPRVNDLQEALALGVSTKKKIDIIVSSWGPKDDGKSIGKPGILSELALIKGVEKGRGGKGAIFVWAVGNGGLKDNCNLDGYASSIYTISINSMTQSGYTCLYDEPCSATLASVYVGGKHDPKEPHHDNMVVPQLNGDCINSFQGTSAAAPLAAGIIALMLQANGDLTWRDVQHIIVKSARKSADESNWRRNGAGLLYHHFYGFGAIDASKAVNLALNWSSVPIQSNCVVKFTVLPREVPPKSNIKLLADVMPSIENSKPFKLEHVLLKITLKNIERGKIEIFILSPSGTESQLLTERPLDVDSKIFMDWGFVSTHFWLENPVGTWTIIFLNHSENRGILESATLTLFGSFY